MPTEAQHKKFARHQKLFNIGMQQFEQGLDEPKDKDSPEFFGWQAAKEMRDIKQKWLSLSREKHELS